MKVKKVFVVGDSLFAETLIEIFGQSDSVVVLGIAPTMEEYLTLIEGKSPDVVIVAVADENVTADFTPILIANPNVPIIHADIKTNQVQVITNEPIDAHVSDLLAAIAGLPDRHLDSDL